MHVRVPVHVCECMCVSVHFSAYLCHSAAGDCGSSVVVTVSVGDCTSSTYGSSTLASPLLAAKRSARSFRRSSRNFHTPSMTYVMVAKIPLTFRSNDTNENSGNVFNCSKNGKASLEETNAIRSI